MSTTRHILKTTANRREELQEPLLATTEREPLDEEETPLEKHIKYFGGNQGEGISFTSIKEQNIRLGDSLLAASVNATLVSAASGAKIKGCPFSLFNAKEAIGVLNHPQSSGIFHLDGTLNENRWDILLRYSQERFGKPDIITETRFYEFLNYCRQIETRADPFKMGLMASNGEWKAFFDKFASSTQAGTRYVTIERLRNFFEDSGRVGLEIEREISDKKKFGM